MGKVTPGNNPSGIGIIQVTKVIMKITIEITLNLPTESEVSLRHYLQEQLSPTLPLS